MGHLSYQEGKKVVYRGLILLGIVTIVEVFIALIGNGHVVEGFTMPKYIMYPLMISLSLYKAAFIMREFMHLKYELNGLTMSVVLPTVLLVWAIIAFFWEGESWKENREKVEEKNEMKVEESIQPTGMNTRDSQTYNM
jgi:cytochrome c oxidase subunit 4